MTKSSTHQKSHLSEKGVWNTSLRLKVITKIEIPNCHISNIMRRLPKYKTFDQLYPETPEAIKTLATFRKSFFQ